MTWHRAGRAGGGIVDARASASRCSTPHKRNTLNTQHPTYLDTLHTRHSTPPNSTLNSNNLTLITQHFTPDTEHPHTTHHTGPGGLVGASSMPDGKSIRMKIRTARDIAGMKSCTRNPNPGIWMSKPGTRIPNLGARDPKDGTCNTKPVT